jgi:hypothetical protein
MHLFKKTMRKERGPGTHLLVRGKEVPGPIDINLPTKELVTAQKRGPGSGA